jgi:hypothetical protein
MHSIAKHPLPGDLNPLGTVGDLDVGPVTQRERGEPLDGDGPRRRPPRPAWAAALPTSAKFLLDVLAQPPNAATTSWVMVSKVIEPTRASVIDLVC